MQIKWNFKNGVKADREKRERGAKIMEQTKNLAK